MSKNIFLRNESPGGVGEANTASNQGVGGVGLFKQKTSVDLEFKNINAGSSKITVTDDTGNDEVDIDVDEAQIDHLNIQNIGTNSHAQIDTHIADSSIHFTEGSIDHGSISGLLDDDHSQYALLVGRSGGQNLIGGTASGDDLTFNSTSNATKGNILFGDSAGFNYNETDVMLSIGGPGQEITIAGTTFKSRFTTHMADATVASSRYGGHSATPLISPNLLFNRSRGTEGSPLAVLDDDRLGIIQFSGHDGTDYNYAASIQVDVDGTPGANDMPGRIVFSVSPDGSNTPVDAVKILNDKTLELLGNISDGTTSVNTTEIVDFFNATDITGAEAETLTDGSNADSLHLHSFINLDDTPATYSGQSGKMLVVSGTSITFQLQPTIPNSFATWDADLGTNPAASTGNDTMTVTSANSSINITGDSGTDTLTFDINLTNAQTWSGVQTFSSLIGADAGLDIPLPSSGSSSDVFMVDTAANDPGLRFNRPSASIGQIIFGDTATTQFEFDILGANAGMFYMRPLSSAPTGKQGTLYVDTSGILWIHNGTSWVKVGLQT